jgi:hypothetical protein
MASRTHSAESVVRSAHLDPPDRLPILQALEATLAGIDFVYERELAAIENSATDEPVKQRAISKLQERYREQRAPYVRQLASLREQ